MNGETAAASSPRFRRVVAIVNPLSGGVGPHAARDLEGLLGQTGLDAEVIAPAPGQLDAALAQAARARPDLLITLAGDGTARAAAALCGPDGPAMAPLPGGTMNLLPKALYGERRWPEALTDALAHGVIRPVSGGEVAGQAFYVAAVLGAPALWAPAREAARNHKIRKALLGAQVAIRNTLSGRVRFSLDGGPHQKAEALTLVCPLVSKIMHDDGALEAAALNPSTPRDVVRIGLRAFFSNLFGDWRDDPAVSIGLCRQGQVWSRRWIPGTLDGEPVRLARNLAINFRPVSFHALALPSDRLSAHA